MHRLIRKSERGFFYSYGKIRKFFFSIARVKTLLGGRFFSNANLFICSMDKRMMADFSLEGGRLRW